MINYKSLIIENVIRLEVLDLTDRVNYLLSGTHVHQGLINLWTVHTTAALTINENEGGLWTRAHDTGQLWRDGFWTVAENIVH